MLVTVGIENRDHQRLEDIRQGYREFLALLLFISVAGEEENPVMLGSNTLSGKDSMRLYICGNMDRITVSAQFDNLGKGASGAALESMNIALGLDPTTGLSL